MRVLRCSAVVISLSLAGGRPVSGQAAAQVAPDGMTAASLNEIAVLSPADAAVTSRTLRAELPALTGGRRQAQALLIGVALEQAGDRTAAIEAYRSAGAEAGGTPYAVTAVQRLRVLEVNPPTKENLERFFATAASSPEATGWFRARDGWAWTTTRRAAWQALVDLRADRPSFRLFSLLRARSPFEPAYGYLFVLAALGIGAKILELPLYVRMSQLQLQLRRLEPEVAGIRAAYGDDPTLMNRELWELYKRNDVRFLGGCAVAIVDMVFVLWATFALQDFAPRLALDGARFPGVADVTRFDARAVGLWSATLLIVPMLSPDRRASQAGQVLGGGLVTLALFSAIGWYWNWPAYVFVFWAMLGVLGLAVQYVLYPVRKLV